MCVVWFTHTNAKIHTVSIHYTSVNSRFPLFFFSTLTHAYTVYIVHALPSFHSHSTILVLSSIPISFTFTTHFICVLSFLSIGFRCTNVTIAKKRIHGKPTQTYIPMRRKKKYCKTYVVFLFLKTNVPNILRTIVFNTVWREKKWIKIKKISVVLV